MNKEFQKYIELSKKLRTLALKRIRVLKLKKILKNE